MESILLITHLSNLTCYCYICMSDLYSIKLVAYFFKAGFALAYKQKLQFRLRDNCRSIDYLVTKYSCVFATMKQEDIIVNVKQT